MYWNGAVERNRTHLLRILAALFALIGIEPGGSVDRLHWSVYKVVERFVRPAEAAVRRLIYMAAKDIVLKPVKQRTGSGQRSKAAQGQTASKKSIPSETAPQAVPSEAIPSQTIPTQTGTCEKKQRKDSFPLFDPRKPLPGDDELAGLSGKSRSPEKKRPLPRILLLDAETSYPWGPEHGGTGLEGPVNQQAQDIDIILPTPEELGLGSVARLCRRLARIKAALDDIPHHALRLARVIARPLDEQCRKPLFVMRRGQPPGLPKKINKNIHYILEDVQHLLKEVHLLAISMPPPRPNSLADTS